MNGTSNIHLTKMKSILITEETQSKKKLEKKLCCSISVIFEWTEASKRQMFSNNFMQCTGTEGNDE